MRLVLGTARAMVESATALSESVSRTLEQVEVLQGEPDPDAPPGRPFDVREYQQTSESITETVREINTLLESTNGVLASSGWIETQAEAEAFVGRLQRQVTRTALWISGALGASIFLSLSGVLLVQRMLRPLGDACRRARGVTPVGASASVLVNLATSGPFRVETRNAGAPQVARLTRTLAPRANRSDSTCTAARVTERRRSMRCTRRTPLSERKMEAPRVPEIQSAVRVTCRCRRPTKASASAWVSIHPDEARTPLVPSSSVLISRTVSVIDRSSAGTRGRRRDDPAVHPDPAPPGGP